jgi:uncharacterized membrane protein
MEELLAGFSRVAATLIEAGAVLVVAFGALDAFARLLRLMVKPGTPHGARKAVWQGFGMWLLLGLEFELAADIIRSVVAPTWQDLGELGAIAVIRTFLNYFLEKDLEQVDRGAESPAAKARE